MIFEPVVDPLLMLAQGRAEITVDKKLKRGYTYVYGRPQLSKEVDNHIRKGLYDRKLRL